MKNEIRAQARAMRQNGLSVRDIALELGVSRGSVSQWVRGIELTEEQVRHLKEKQHQWGGRNNGAQANRDRFRERRKVYQEEGRAKAREGRSLHMIGCMLHWAEGAKHRNHVNFVNSDPNMMQLYLRFLKEELCVRENDIILYIHCHTRDETVIDRIKQYWLNLLHLPESSIRQVLFKQGSNTRKNILENGVCSVRIYNTQLVQHIYGAIQEYGGFDNPAWLD